MTQFQFNESDIQKITRITEKNIKSLFILLKAAQAAVQKTSRNNATSTVLIFFFFSFFLMDVMCGKITINFKVH